MNPVIEEMLKAYNIQSLTDKKNAMKEIMQELVLCGLSRAGFFREAAFYGGTALRIFYGLDRFSEDLDFSLQAADENFDLSAYFPILENEIKSLGLHVEISEKEKSRDSKIRSAFLKGNTKEQLLLFYEDREAAGSVAGSEVIKIKFEVDTHPPKYAGFEHKYRLLPSPYELMLYDIPSLFAGKIHAVLARAWQSRIKGRDLYDYVFFLSRGAKVNLPHLQQRLIDSGFLSEDSPCEIEDVKRMLCERFASIDYSQAKEDLKPFLRSSSALDIWDTDFFRQITENLKCSDSRE